MYVEKVARFLTEIGFRVFYDKYDITRMWGENLYDYLDEIYRKKAHYTVLFISKYYAKKIWTNHERQSAQARALKENVAYILPVRFDKTKIPGMLPTISYLDIKNTTPKELADIIKNKIGPIMRSDFFPKSVDKLFDVLKIRTEKKKKICLAIATILFDRLRLTTSEERALINLIIRFGCAEESPENMHIELSYLSRLSKLSENEIMAIFSRLDCLGFEVRVKKHAHIHDRDDIGASDKNLIIQFDPRIKELPNNGTYVLIGIFELIANDYCEECAKAAVQRLDFSGLSSFAAQPETGTTTKS